MNNLTYNPNVNVPYHNNKFEKYDNSNFDKYDNRSNFDKYDNRNNFERYDNEYSMNDNMPPSLAQMDPRGEPQMNRYNKPNYQMPSQYYQMPSPEHYQNNYKQKPINKKKKTNLNNVRKYENLDEDNEDIDAKNNKINWRLIFKKIIIFTALFLIMSSVKMDELVCKFIPFLNENQLLCMTIKGIILSSIIILTQLLL